MSREPAVYDVNDHVVARLAALAADPAVDAELKAAIDAEFGYITPIDESPGDGTEYMMYTCSSRALPRTPWMRVDEITYFISTTKARVGGMMIEALIDILGVEDDLEFRNFDFSPNYVFHNGVLITTDSLPRSEEAGAYGFTVKFSLMYSPKA